MQWVVFVSCFLPIITNALIFTSKSCGTEYEVTFDRSQYTFTSTAPAYSRCRLSTDLSLPWDVQYNITLRIQNSGWSTPGIFFNEVDDLNYDFLFFRTVDTECVIPGTVQDNVVQYHQAFNQVCGHQIGEGTWFDVFIMVTSSVYQVYINTWAPLSFPIGTALRPSLGLIHGIGTESSCGYNCRMNTNDLNVLPTTSSMIRHDESEGTLEILGAPIAQNQITVFRINIDNSAHPVGTYCIVSLYYDLYDVGNGVLSVRDITEHTQGSFETYSTNDRYLDVLFNSFDITATDIGFTIGYSVIQCGIDDEPTDMSFLCTAGNYIDLYEDYYRSTSNTQDEGYSDSALTRGWYRFSSCAGGTIPNTSPCVECKCGTQNPIWMNDGNQERVCMNSGDVECAEEWKVPVYKCPDFVIYYLTPTPENSGYCAGSKRKCNTSNDEVSRDGSGCGPCDDGRVPQMSQSPTIGHWVPVNGGYGIECQIYGPLDQMDEVQYYVEWLIDYGTHREVIYNSKVYEAISAHKLLSTVLRHEHLQNKLICQVKAKFTDGQPGDWMESVSFFLGIQVTQAPDVITEEPNAVSIKLTAPISATGQTDCGINLLFVTTTDELQQQTACSNFLYLQPELVHYSPCAHKITCADWNMEVVHQMHVKNTVQKLPKKFHSHTLYVVTKSQDNTLWNNVATKVMVPVNTSNNGDDYLESECFSHNDPHIQTFRGIEYDVHQEGEYILYKSTPEKDLNMDVLITAEFYKCNKDKDIYCNNAVAVRVKNEIIIIDDSKPLKHRYIGPGYGEKGFRLTLSKNRKIYRIYLPRGEKVVVNLEPNYGRINVDIHSLLEQQFRGASTGGLCGKIKPGTSKAEELIDTHGKEFLKDGWKSGDKFGKWEVVNTFGDIWRASADDELVNTDCYPQLQTDPQSSVYSCQFRTAYEIFAATLYHPDLQAETRSIDRCIRKSDGDTELMGNLRLQSKSETCKTDRKRRQTIIKKFKTPRRISRSEDVVWTNETAYAYCYDQIVDSSTGKACDHLIPDAVTSSLHMCAVDILLTNSTEWTLGTVDSLRENCISTLYKRLDLWNFDNDTSSNSSDFSPPAYIIDGLCPNDCSIQGACIDELCKCYAGYVGSDCSFSDDTSPILKEMLSGNICSYNEDCGQLLIAGYDLIPGGDLTCHFTIEQQHSSTTDNEQANANIDIPGSLISYGVISCSWPLSTYETAGFTTLSVTISNDGAHKSLPLTGIAIVHSECFTCEGEGGEVDCHLQTDWCMIDGNCIRTQATSISDECMICDPDVDTAQWSSSIDCAGRPGILPSHIAAIVIGCIAILAIVVGIVLMVLSKCWTWRKVDGTRKYLTGSKSEVQEVKSARAGNTVQ